MPYYRRFHPRDFFKDAKSYTITGNGMLQCYVTTVQQCTTQISTFSLLIILPKKKLYWMAFCTKSCQFVGKGVLKIVYIRFEWFFTKMFSLLLVREGYVSHNLQRYCTSSLKCGVKKKSLMIQKTAARCRQALSDTIQSHSYHIQKNTRKVELSHV